VSFFDGCTAIGVANKRAVDQIRRVAGKVAPVVLLVLSKPRQLFAGSIFLAVESKRSLVGDAARCGTCSWTGGGARRIAKHGAIGFVSCVRVRAL
jgi:hypothetical protein